MGALGDLLEAMHEAPRSSSLHGVARHGQDHEKLREAIERRNRSGGAHATLMMVATSGEGEAIPAGLPESPVEFWSSPLGWRVDQAQGRTIAADGKVLRFFPGMGGIISELDDLPLPFDGLGMYLAPAQWFGGMRFRIVGDELEAQRSC
jgi:hypothetical protein